MRKFAPFLLAVFIVLTRTDDKPVMFNVDQIISVTESIDVPPYTHVATQGVSANVKETFNEVNQKIRNAK